MPFDNHLRSAGVCEADIASIMGVPYERDAGNPKQDTANFMAAALRRCEQLLNDATLIAVMYDRACCKSGMRLKNSRAFAKEHKDKPLDQRLRLLGDVLYMGKPYLNGDGDIETLAVGGRDASGMSCPCWHLSGARPAGGPMPLSYCRCCAGHFQFHYQKALGLPLRLKRVVSSILNSEGSKPCVFVYEILKEE